MTPREKLQKLYDDGIITKANFDKARFFLACMQGASKYGFDNMFNKVTEMVQQSCK